MSAVTIREMDPSDEPYVGTCTHVGESAEIDAAGNRRIAWLREKHPHGLRIQVALLDGVRVGFLYVIPIEICPWGPLGEDLLVIPCLVVTKEGQGHGAGLALIRAAERETRRQGRKGLATTAYYHDFWFLPAPFFERCGFSVAARRGQVAVLWKAMHPEANPPRLLRSHHHFAPIPGKVVVDLFWNAFCQTSNIEAQRVREVAAEFGPSVVLREYSADDREGLRRHGLPRGIFVNGTEIDWGYEAPKDGIREAVSRALQHLMETRPGSPSPE